MCPIESFGERESGKWDLLNAAPDAIIVVDQAARIVNANEMAEDLFGWPTEELVGEQLESLIPELSQEAHALHLTRYVSEPESRPAVVDLGLWALRRDGSEFPIRISLNPWDDDDSTLFVASFRDDSPRRFADESLRASEQMFRLAAAHTADIIQQVNVEKDWIRHFGNLTEVTGFKKGEFPNTVSGWFELIHPDDRDRIRSEVEGIIEAGGKEWSVSYRILGSDGLYHHWRDRGTVTEWNEEGRSIAGVGAIQDVTKQVQARERREKALRELKVARESLAVENVYLWEELQGSFDDGDIIGECENWQRVLTQIHLVAGSDTPVLLTGETGTGKDLLARALHARSSRSERPLITVNCALLPSALIESELFGHEKGAFSGADARRTGRFEVADKGTIFLDEIAEIPPELQAKLLRVLEDGEFERLGSSKTLDADVRVISATNRDLQAAMREGLFRSDLYYRLAVFPVELPPLRDRPQDIPLLTTYFLSRHNAKHAKSIRIIPKRTMRWLQSCHWPGNVRELDNLIERAVILSSGKTLRIDFELKLTHGDEGQSPSRLSKPPPHSGRGFSRQTLKEIEREHILATLEESSWKVKGRGNAAERLGLKESTLRARMKKLGIKRPKR